MDSGGKFLGLIVIGTILVAGVVSCNARSKLCADRGMEVSFLNRGPVMCVAPGGQLYDPGKF